MGNSSSNIRARPEYNPVLVAQDGESPAPEITRGGLTVEFLSIFLQDRSTTHLVIFDATPTATASDVLLSFAATIQGDVIYAHPSENASYQLVKLPKNISHVPLFRLWNEPRDLFLLRPSETPPLLIVDGFTDSSFLSRVPTRKEFPKRFNDRYSKWNGKTICVVRGLPPARLERSIKDATERWIIVDE